LGGKVGREEGGRRLREEGEEVGMQHCCIDLIYFPVLTPTTPYLHHTHRRKGEDEEAPPPDVE